MPPISTSSTPALLLFLAACLPEPKTSLYDPDHDWDRDSFTERDGDCDDDDPARNPGADEVCNATDDDCNGAADDEPSDLALFYVDGDGDTWGGAEILACEAPDGVAARGGDCDDAADGVYPGAPERCGDAIDQDCDSSAPACRVAGDLDGSDATERVPGMFPERAGDVLTGGGAELGHGQLVHTVARITTFGASTATFEIDGAPLSLGPRRTRATAAGDLTGDGAPDVLAIFWSAFNESAGSDVFLVPGPVDGSVALDASTVRFSTTNGFDALGTGAAAGDLDGDGFGDVLLGAPGWNGSAGAVFLVRGPDVPASGAVDVQVDGVQIDGRSQGDDALGGDLAVPGDVDGDGVDDALLATVGLDLYDGSEVYLVLGGDLQRGYADEIAVFDWFIRSIANTEEDGPAVSGIDDLDGDGLPEVAFSAPPDGLGHGAVAWIVAGIPGLASEGEPDDDAFARILGDPAGSFGSDLAGLGDLDGDGLPELLVGAERGNRGFGATGDAVVLGGAELSGGGTFDVRAGDAVIATILGGGVAEYRGSGVAGLGDADGDGWPDFAVGSGLELPIEPNTWLFLGGPL